MASMRPVCDPADLLLRDDDVLCSLDYPTSGFAAHGEFQARYADGVLHLCARGPFNEEALHQFGQLRAEAYRRWQFDRLPTVGVMEWQQSALMSPQAFQLYQGGFERFFAAHAPWRGVAWVAEPGLEGMAYMHARFERLYGRYAMPFRLFAERSLAWAWARERLAAAAP